MKKEKLGILCNDSKNCTEPSFSIYSLANTRYFLRNKFSPLRIILCYENPFILFLMNFSFERKIPHNPLFRLCLCVVLLLTVSPLCEIFSQDKSGGAVIVTNLIGQVHLADENGSKIDRKETVGSLLKEGEFAVTDKSSSLMLLFLNSIHRSRYRSIYSR